MATMSNGTDQIVIENVVRNNDTRHHGLNMAVRADNDDERFDLTVTVRNNGAAANITVIGISDLSSSGETVGDQAALVHGQKEDLTVVMYFDSAGSGQYELKVFNIDTNQYYSCTETFTINVLEAA